MNWISRILQEWADLAGGALHAIRSWFNGFRIYEIALILLSMIVIGMATSWGLNHLIGPTATRAAADPQPKQTKPTPLPSPPPPPPEIAQKTPPKPEKPTRWRPTNCNPVREEPSRFRNGQRMPTQRESSSSVGIDNVPFDDKRDLIRIDDPRVWWESDHDDHTGDTEDDHLFHYSMEKPMCRLIELTLSRGGRLRVTDSFRAHGVHHAKSLHKQGRAVDCTWENPNKLTPEGRPERLPLSTLAKMCWAAGFDWVYFEKDHIHASVRPDHGEDD